MISWIYYAALNSSYDKSTAQYCFFSHQASNFVIQIHNSKFKYVQPGKLYIRSRYIHTRLIPLFSYWYVYGLQAVQAKRVTRSEMRMTASAVETKDVPMKESSVPKVARLLGECYDCGEKADWFVQFRLCQEWLCRACEKRDEHYPCYGQVTAAHDDDRQPMTAWPSC